MSITKLAGNVESAPNKSLGFDTDTKLNYELAKSFYNEGYRFAIRYVSLGSEASGDLTYEEANAILEAGLALMPVQHVPSEDWEPNASLGKEYGNNAAINADHAGFPPTVNVWCDLEGVVSGVSPQSIIDYCNNWYDAVAAYGYIPGLYVGARCGLNEDQLGNLKFEHYWKSESEVPWVPVGYEMIQEYYPEPVNGIGIDKDVTYLDDQNKAPMWLIRG